MLTPLPIDDDISSLSAILLDNNYYNFLKEGRTIVNDITVLGAEYLIPFKMNAWLDLSNKKASGEHVDNKNIKKHKNDVFRLSELIDTDIKILVENIIYADIVKFVKDMEKEEIDLKKLGIPNKTKEQILNEILELYTVK